MVRLLLIEAGANPNSRGLMGITPLLVAAQGGHVDAIREPLLANC